MAEPKVLQKRSISSRKQITLVVQDQNARAVCVSGDFTEWSQEGIPLSRGLNGDWQTILTLDPGEYQYRLRIDGQWQDHPEAQKRIPNPFGSENCVLSVMK
jgi:1,4-alpha-glucan branching enzyme